MARIAVGSYLVPYPVGGYLSWVLQWLLGFHRLGHQVFYAEKSWNDQYFDPVTFAYTPDPSHGLGALASMMERFGLGDRWSFVDARGEHYGVGHDATLETLSTADLFVDMGAHGQWEEETATAAVRVLVDGEPGFNQMRMEQRIAAGERLPEYDAYYTVGLNVGAPDSKVPTVGRAWRPVLDPVATELFPVTPPPAGAPFTTMMSWQAQPPIRYRGATYGQKDVEFERFLDLPRKTSHPLEVAVGGSRVPRERLEQAGWVVHESHRLSRTLDDFWSYIRRSVGEWSVCRNVYVATRSGFFSDRSAAYLASARPVVLQDTGWSSYLPTGRGLFAFDRVEQAAAGLDAIQSDPERHSTWARELAVEHLDTRVVLARFLADLGIR
jgi:hypothetical protein